MRLVALGMIALGAAAIACLDATEIIVELSTDMPCSSFSGAAIGFQHPNEANVEIVTQAVQCSGSGTIGSLVIVPAQSSDVGLIIVAATTDGSAPEDCMTTPISACIVARRKIAFVPHTTVNLPILLESACAGVTCDPATSCTQGTCVAL